MSPPLYTKPAKICRIGQYSGVACKLGKSRPGIESMFEIGLLKLDCRNWIAEDRLCGDSAADVRL